MSIPRILVEIHAAAELYMSKGPLAEESNVTIEYLKANIESSRDEGDSFSIPDLVERIRLAEMAQSALDEAQGENPDAKFPPLQLNLAHLAYFLYADKDGLERLVRVNNVFLDFQLRSIEPFLKMVLQKIKNKFPDIPSPGGIADPDDDSKDSLYQPGVKRRKLNRDRSQTDKARERDQSCIATGCPEIEACHIMPFSLNNTADSLQNACKYLRQLVMPMLSIPDWDMLEKLLIPGNKELGTLDKAWNLLCMNPLAYSIWDKAYFALEWIGLSDKGELDNGTYKTVRLRWHWLPDSVADALDQSYLHERTASKGDTGRLLKLNSESHDDMATAINRHLASTSKISSHGVTLTRMSNLRPLVSGNILLIRVNEEDLDKTRLMISIQWLALRMAAICGAADVVDDLDSETPSRLADLPTYSELPVEDDELYDIDLPLHGQNRPGQQLAESADTEESWDSCS